MSIFTVCSSNEQLKAASKFSGTQHLWQ